MDQRSSQPRYTKKHKRSGRLTLHNHQLNCTGKTRNMHSRCGNLTYYEGWTGALLKFLAPTETPNFKKWWIHTYHTRSGTPDVLQRLRLRRWSFYTTKLKVEALPHFSPDSNHMCREKRERVWKSLNTRLLFMFLNLDVARVHGWIRPWRSAVQRQIRRRKIRLNFARCGSPTGTILSSENNKYSFGDWWLPWPPTFPTYYSRKMNSACYLSLLHRSAADVTSEGGFSFRIPRIYFLVKGKSWRHTQSCFKLQKPASPCALATETRDYYSSELEYAVMVSAHTRTLQQRFG